HGEAGLAVGLPPVGDVHDLVLHLRVAVVDTARHSPPGIALLEDASGNAQRLVGGELVCRRAGRELAPGHQAQQPAVARRELPRRRQRIAARRLARAHGLGPALDVDDIALAERALAALAAFAAQVA